MKFYKIKSSADSDRFGLMAKDEEDYCYVYSANTSMWHRSKSRELDMAFEQEAFYELVDKEQAVSLLLDLSPTSHPDALRYVQRLDDQRGTWKRTSEQVGLDVPRGSIKAE